MLEKAIEVASKAHQHQIRKGSNTPYIVHPFTVGMLLLQQGLTEDIVCAGILHDVVEDTDRTLEDIRGLFGHRVADIVEGCSEPDKSLSWEERKQHTIDYVKDAPFQIKVVICADKLHNLRTMKTDYKVLGDDLWNRFKRGKEKQAWYYQSLLENLCTEENLNGHIDLFRKLKKEVNEFFGEV